MKCGHGHPTRPADVHNLDLAVLDQLVDLAAADAKGSRRLTDRQEKRYRRGPSGGVHGFVVFYVAQVTTIDALGPGVQVIVSS